MKTRIFRIGMLACLILAVLFTASCAKKGELDDEVALPDDCRIQHGIVKEIEGNRLLVYFGRCNDLDDIDRNACTYVPTKKVMMELGEFSDEKITLSDIAVGDFVHVYYDGNVSETAPMQISKVYRISKCRNITETYTVGDFIWGTGALTLYGGDGAMSLGQSLFDAGYVLENGVPVSYDSIRPGDTLEIEHSGMILMSYPGQFEDIHYVRVVGRTDEVKYRGVVKENLGTHLLVYYGDCDEIDDVNDIADISAADCLRVPLDGVTLVSAVSSELAVSIADIAAGDRVTVTYKGEGFESAPSEACGVCRIALYKKQTMAVTVSEILENHIVTADEYGTTRNLVRSDHCDYRLYEDGKVISVFTLNVGDRLEIDYDRNLTYGSFNEIFAARVISRAAAAEPDTTVASDLTERVVTVYGTFKRFNSRGLVYFEECADPADIEYFLCTTLSLGDAPITDGVTGETLAWSDLSDGDYLAVETNGMIAESAPGQMHTVYSVTRIPRTRTAAEVTAISADGAVTLTMADGSIRTLSSGAVEEFQVERLAYPLAELCVGDRVQLDEQPLREEQPYTLHLLYRELTAPEGAVTEVFEVTHVNGSEIVVGEGIAIKTRQFFYDINGEFTALYFGHLNTGDLLEVTYDGEQIGSEPIVLGEIYLIRGIPAVTAE